MKKTVMLILQLVVFAIVMIGLGVVVKQLIASGRYSNPQLTALQQSSLKNSLLEIERQKQDVILTALAADKAEQMLREERAIRRKMAVASQERLWGALWVGVVVSLFAGALVMCVGLAGGIVKIFWVHGDIIAGGLVRKAIPLETRLEIEQERVLRAAMNLQGRLARQSLPEAIDVTPEAEQTRIQTRFDGPEALTLRVPGTILIGKNSDGQPVNLPLSGILNGALIGDPGSGKSNLLALMTAQARVDGGLVYMFDLHGHNKESLACRTGKVASLPGVKVCKDSENVLEMEREIRGVIDKRLKTHDVAGLPGVLIVFSEIIGLCSAFPSILDLLRKIVSEARKGNISSLSDSQDWTKDSVSAQAILRMMETKFCLRVSEEQSKMFFGRKLRGTEEYAKGQVLVRVKGRRDVLCQSPLMALADMDALATQAQPIRAEHLPGKQVAPILQDMIINFEDEKMPVKKDNVTPIFRHGW